MKKQEGNEDDERVQMANEEEEGRQGEQEAEREREKEGQREEKEKGEQESGQEEMSDEKPPGLEAKEKSEPKVEKEEELKQEEQVEDGRQTLFFTAVDPMHEPLGEQDYDVSKPRVVPYKSKWNVHRTQFSGPTCQFKRRG